MLGRVVQGGEGGRVGTDPFFEPGGDPKVRGGLPSDEGKKEVLGGVDSAEVVDVGVVE